MRRQMKGPVGKRAVRKTGNPIGHGQISVRHPGRVLLLAVEAHIECSVGAEQTIDEPAAGRLVRSEVVIEAVVFLIDDDDVIDVLAQRPEVRRVRCIIDPPRPYGLAER